jgi:hypothetical protein
MVCACATSLSALYGLIRAAGAHGHEAVKRRAEQTLPAALTLAGTSTNLGSVEITGQTVRTSATLVVDTKPAAGFSGENNPPSRGRSAGF